MRRYLLVLLLVAVSATFLVMNYIKKSNDPAENTADKRAAAQTAVQFAEQLLSYDEWEESTDVRGMEHVIPQLQNFLRRDHRYFYEWIEFEYGADYLPHVDEVAVSEVYPVKLPEKKARQVYAVNLVVHYNIDRYEHEDYMEPGLLVAKQADGKWRVAGLMPYHHLFPDAD